MIMSCLLLLSKKSGSVEELDFDIGTRDVCCDCSNSGFCYELVGHIVTGDLTIIRDAKL